LVPDDPFKPAFTNEIKPDQVSEPQPGDEDIVRALVEIQHASQASNEADQFLRNGQPQYAANGPIVPPSSRSAKLLIPVLVYLVVFIFAVRMVRLSSTRRPSQSTNSYRSSRPVDAAAQNEIEVLLARVAVGDSAAATDVLERAPSWTGKTQRTQNTDRSITIALNLPDLHQREAAIEATLALDGVAKSEAEIKTLEAQLTAPSNRSWALWTLGALGHRGVDPVHTAKMIGAYIESPDASTRAAAVDALSVLATDETIPMLLDRMRNDPSPLVQERAACALAESGMYTQPQRVAAAATLVSWLDDSLLSAQQHQWTIQALSDISHQHFGNDSGAWRSWLDSAHQQPQSK
jgi:hypothetical protein